MLRGLHDRVTTVPARTRDALQRAQEALGVVSASELTPKQRSMVRMVARTLRKVAAQLGGGDWIALFKMLDRDGSGVIDADELRFGLRKTLKLSASRVSDDDIGTLLRAIDKDGSGMISNEELQSFVEGAGGGPLLARRAARARQVGAGRARAPRRARALELGRPRPGGRSDAEAPVARPPERARDGAGVGRHTAAHARRRAGHGLQVSPGGAAASHASRATTYHSYSAGTTSGADYISQFQAANRTM